MIAKFGCDRGKLRAKNLPRVGRSRSRLAPRSARCARWSSPRLGRGVPAHRKKVCFPDSPLREGWFARSASAALRAGRLLRTRFSRGVGSWAWSTPPAGVRAGRGACGHVV